MNSAANRYPAHLKALIYGFITLWVILAAFTFFWTLWGSFKVELDFFSIADWTNALTGKNTSDTYGSSFTDVGYAGAWIQEEFWRSAINTAIVCFFVVCTSLTIGTLGGYALSARGIAILFGY